MKMLLYVVAAIFLAGPAIAATPDDVLGVWKTRGDRSRIELYKCGEKICGKVAWLREPKFTRAEDGPVGETKVDLQNSDPELQKRPILGLQVIEGLTFVGDGKWEKGQCYDPESGNSYKCNMRCLPPETLKLRGYMGFSLLGRTYTLTR